MERMENRKKTWVWHQDGMDVAFNSIEMTWVWHYYCIEMALVWHWENIEMALR